MSHHHDHGGHHMDLLKRGLAPIIPDAWDQIDEEAKRVFRLNLAGRRLVDFDGPHGWTLGAANLGRLELLKKEPVPGVHAGRRIVKPLTELRIPIRLATQDLDNVGRGGDPDLEPVVDAAERIARVEDGAIFNGDKDMQIEGILPASPHKPVTLPKDASAYGGAIVQAKQLLVDAGIEGPYRLALGPEAYDAMARATTDHDYPVQKRITSTLIDGPILRAPTLTGGVLMSTRGGDYTLTVGQDLSVGYAHHDKDQVELYLTEGFTFTVIEPAAAVPLKSAK